MQTEFSLPDTVYILGNGPYLPVSELHRLGEANCFTIGINKLLRSGFDPTILFFNDPEHWDDATDVALMDKCDALLVSNASHFHKTNRPRVVWLRTYTPGDKCSRQMFSNELHINGSSLICMVEWAMRVGFKKAHIMGHDCTVATKEVPSHFYGPHPLHYAELRYWHESDFRTRMLEATRRMVEAFGDRVLISNEIPQNLDGSATMSQNDMRQYVRRELFKR